MTKLTEENLSEKDLKSRKKLQRIFIEALKEQKKLEDESEPLEDVKKIEESSHWWNLQKENEKLKADNLSFKVILVLSGLTVLYLILAEFFHPSTASTIVGIIAIVGFVIYAIVESQKED